MTHKKKVSVIKNLIHAAPVNREKHSVAPDSRLLVTNATNAEKTLTPLLHKMSACPKSGSWSTIRLISLLVNHLNWFGCQYKPL